jgi:hypothetical protein
MSEGACASVILMGTALLFFHLFDEWHDASTQIYLPQFTAKDGPMSPALNFQHINYLFYLVHPGNM